MVESRVIIIIATWSSGSTALTGFLHHCGAYTCPPYQRTNDERTPHSFEPALYAVALRKLFDEFSLQQKGDLDDFKNFFEKFFPHEAKKAKQLGFKTIALKQPLQTLILPYLHEFLNPKYVFVTRPFDKIESTRMRRNWNPIYGATGAKQIYTIATNFLISQSCTYLTIPYEALISDVKVRQTLLSFCELDPTDDMLIAAEKFIKES